MELVKVFGDKFQGIIQDDITKAVLLEENDNLKDDDDDDGGNSGEIEAPSTELNISAESRDLDRLSCSYCKIRFDNVSQQREHYKLDWHRYNLRQSLLGKTAITEEEFNGKTDDVSSISGSDSDSATETFITAQGRIFLQNPKTGQVFSLHTAILCDKKDELDADLITQRLREYCITNKLWAILMLGGGHFAGAIFNGETPILHKTFHCYTVRAGQGGAQSARDSKNAGSHPKSAGASLRRYNEQALLQHVRGILQSWRDQLEGSSLIFYRAAGPYNRNALFGGPQGILERSNPRLRTIPFSTRRATFAEVKRVHSILITARVFDCSDTALKYYSKQNVPQTSPRRAKGRGPVLNRARSRELIDRPLPDVTQTLVGSSDESGDGSQLESADELVDFGAALEEFGDTLTHAQRKAAKKKRPRKSKARKLREGEEQRKLGIIQMLIKGNVEEIKDFLASNRDNLISLLSEQLDCDGNSFLHLLALNEHRDALILLLENGADPCLRNNKQQTPYSCTQSREIRDALKEFARDNPDKYNYNKAQIPINTLAPDELAEKRRAQRKVKREKEKVKRQQNEIKKQEEGEKERFLKLSDREKRALAAERRILSQSGTVTARCFLCAADISGKVPFEYLGNRFCSIDCLKAHRLQNPPCLS